jgi:hypothetical protein
VSTPVRALTCRIPRADPAAASSAACTRPIRPAAKCGDAGGCYCRFAYSLSATITREDWDCGRCCAALTNDFGLDLIDRANNTRTNCESDTFPFKLPTEQGCGNVLLKLEALLDASPAAAVPPALGLALVLGLALAC